MHEATVAASLIEIIKAESAKQNARPIAAKISCGVLNAVNDESLVFAFEAIAKGTICEGLKLQIEHKPMQARCLSCGQLSEFHVHRQTCPHCSSNDLELLPDAELVLDEIEFEKEG